MDASSYTLGIDIGTSSIKIAIVDTAGVVVENVTTPLDANVPSDVGSQGAEQCPYAIWNALQAGLRQLDPDNQVKVQTIGISGQMHGLILWQQGKSWLRTNDQTRHIDLQHLSHLYTWQDQRCTKEFLASLPKPDSHLHIASGYGCVTLMWLLHNRPQFLTEQGFTCAGTIMDFVVAAICDLERPVTSDQLAASFGYYNVFSGTWNVDILKSCGFPVHVLPEVVKAGQVAGHLQQGLDHIPAGTPVLAAMGDMQCGVLAGVQYPGDAALNISTSIQLCMPVADTVTGGTMGAAVEVVPYFNNAHLAVVAGLNGGDVLMALASMVKGWLQEIGLGEGILETALLERLSYLGKQSPGDSRLRISPTVSGERHDPDLLASASGISANNTSLGAMFRAASEGIVDNIFRMLPLEMLMSKGVKRIVGSGSVLQNPLVLNHTQQVLAGKIDFVQGSESDAAFGAAKTALAFFQQQQQK